jgi:ubiquinone/menaquinone biosynthesis C-methylase UbiE
LGKLNFIESYNNWTETLKTTDNPEIAMKKAIGGEFDAMGLMEKDLLIQHGLKPNDYLIDVGCGSGRLSMPLSSYLKTGSYLGTDIVQDLLDFAQEKVNKSNFKFVLTNGFTIPKEENTVDIVSFFSVFTHLLHEQTYNYLIDAKRVLKSGGKIIFSFLELYIPSHWAVFENDYLNLDSEKPLNMFIERDAIKAWAEHLNLRIEGIFDGDKPHIELLQPVTFDSGVVQSSLGNLGQSVCVLVK